MTHPTELELSMWADDALPDGAVVPVTTHIENCASCRARANELKSDSRFITSALQIEPVVQSHDVTVPPFKRPLSLRGFALANLGTGLVIWLAQFLWKTIFGELIMNATTWATSVYLPDIYAVTSATALYLLEEGTAVMNAYLGLIVLSLLTVAALWVVFAYRKSRAVMSVSLMTLVAVTISMPLPVSALEVQRDEDIITVAATDTIDDTLIAAAETVVVEGVVTGDLIALGRTIDVTGTVEGNLISFAETVNVRGSVGGFTLSGASRIDLRSATVDGNLWVGGETVMVDDESNVGSNAVIASRGVTLEGDVGKDLFAFAETVEVSGTLGEDLEAFANRIRLLNGAHVKGDARIRTSSEDQLHRADEAKIDGELEFLDMPEELQPKSRYATLEYYLWQLASLIAAFLVGLIFFWFFRGLQTMSFGSGIDALKSIGIGLIAMVSVPAIVLIVAITLVGFPLAAIAFGCWLLAVYLAKIVVGMSIGRMLMSDGKLALTLLLGLVIVSVAVNLPFIGGIISIAMTLLGLGMLVQYCFTLLRSVQPD